MTLLNKEIFRGFSIRGVWGKDFEADGIEQIARGIGAWFNQRGKRNLVIGYDARVSSPQIYKILCDTLIETGMNIVGIGLVPTPMWNYTTDHLHADGGVMITASHNPAEYNGLKIRSGLTIYADDLEEIYQLAQQPHKIQEPGRFETRNAAQDYQLALMNAVQIYRPLKIVVDGANGANGQFVPGLLRKLGCTVEELFCDVDGLFPNRDPDPTKKDATRALEKKVPVIAADMGLAFDGDGDRVIVVDDLGQKIMGDQILMLLAAPALSKQKNPRVVYDVLCSQVVADYVSGIGGTAIPAASGYAFVHEKMLANRSTLGGESSGHFFLLNDQFRFDDAILAAITLVGLVANSNRKLSSFVADLPRYFPTPTEEDRIPCPDNLKGTVVKTIGDFYKAGGYPVDETDGVKIDFGDTWGLIRQSNTQPVLSIKIESRLSLTKVSEVKRELLGKVLDEFSKMNLDTIGIKTILNKLDNKT